MDFAWIKTSLGAQVIGYFADSRPIWFLSIENEELIWQNPAAKLFKAKIIDNKLQLAPNITLKAGQIANLMELGTFGRRSLSRVKMLLAEQDIAITALVTPMRTKDREYILIVGVDALEQSLFSQYGMSEEIINDIFGQENGFVLLNKHNRLIASSKQQQAIFNKNGTNFLQEFDENALSFSIADGNHLILFSKAKYNKSPREQFSQSVRPDIKIHEEKKIDEQKSFNNLTSLLDQLAADEELFTPLGAKDDEALPIELDLEQQKKQLQPAKHPTLWRIIGEGFMPNQNSENKKVTQEAPSQNKVEYSDILDNEQDQSKYNFNELTRLLTKQVGTEQIKNPPTKSNLKNQQTANSSLVNIPEEKLILNRLPLGLLIFQDQQILFANRAMIDLLEYQNSANLKNTPIGEIFVKPQSENEPAGPISHLVKSNGLKIAINALLYSITWNGKAALMLTASEKESVFLIDRVDDFISIFAKSLGAGIFRANRNGLLSEISKQAENIFTHKTTSLKNYPLSLLVADSEIIKLHEFLEKEARFALNERPIITLKGKSNQFEITLCAEGNAGIISDYLGFVKKVDLPDASLKSLSKGSNDSDMFAHVSRSIRRQLNTIIGFSELIRTKAFGSIKNQLYIDYAGDIKLAGYDILATIDELEDYAKLNDKNFTPDMLEFDLTQLLENCLARVRPLANLSRVLIRSSISLELPQVKADKKILEQAILNLFASAIEQSEEGKQIVVSAYKEIDNSITIHLRDSKRDNIEFAENFVMFRDGVNSDGHARVPKVSSMGLAITETMLEINAVSLEIEQNTDAGTLVSLTIPANMIVHSK